MQKLTRTVCVAMLMAFLLIGRSEAANIWRLGEADSPAAVIGNPSNAITIDSIGGNSLGRVGFGATYTNQVAAPGSTIGINFTGQGGYLGSAILVGPDNWEMEIWADPTFLDGGNHNVIYNGDTSTRGMGIYQSGANWSILFGGIVLQDVAPITLNQWVDLRLIENNGVATFYLNGVATGPSIFGLPNPVALGDAMQIGVNQAGNEGFVGSLDEGSVPEPSTAVLTGLGVIAAFGLFRSKKFAQMI